MSDKQGMSMQELESMVKKYRFEVFFCAAFLIAAIFTTVFNLEGWSIFLAAIGGIIGMLIPHYVDKTVGQVLGFCCKQERVTQLIIAGVLIVVSVIISPVIFLFLGLVGGKAIHKDTLHHKGQCLHSHLDEDHNGNSDEHS